MNSATRLSIAVRYQIGGFSLDAAVEVGEQPVALVGPNGCGKSTLLLAALGIRAPAGGRVVLAGEVLFDSVAGIDRPTEERRMAYVPQDFALFPFLNARENVEFAIASRPGSSVSPGRAERRKQATAALARLGIAHLASRRPDQLSGGERQRVALARAIASQPQALLLDEPTAALDVDARADVRRVLAGIVAELAIPTLIVTHDPGDILALAGRVAVMDAGKIATCMPLSEVRFAPPDGFAARLLGSLVRPHAASA